MAPDSQPQKLEAEHVITIFNGQVKLPEDYLREEQGRRCCRSSTAWDIR